MSDVFGALRAFFSMSLGVGAAGVARAEAAGRNHDESLLMVVSTQQARSQIDVS
jgi:hypothetical protein